MNITVQLISADL